VPGVLSQPATLEVQEWSDADGDGIPDSFESAHGLQPLDPADAQSDADQDGASNLDEYRAGTDLEDPDSVLRVEELEATGTVLVRFTCLESRSYTLLSRDAADRGPWLPMASVPAITNAGNATRFVEIADPAATGLNQRYYRLVTPAGWVP
jgi:hypothetical protein